MPRSPSIISLSDISPFMGALLCLSSVTAVADSLAGSMPAAGGGHQRVILLTSGATQAVAESLRGQIVQALSGQPEEVISQAETRKALAEKTGTFRDCARSDECTEDVARAVSADIILTARLDREGGRSLLTVTRSNPGDPMPMSTSESLHDTSDLSQTVGVCLGKLFPAIGARLERLAVASAPPSSTNQERPTARSAPAPVAVRSSSPDDHLVVLPAIAAKEDHGAAPGISPAGAGSSIPNSVSAPAAVRLASREERVVVLAAMAAKEDSASGTDLSGEVARELALVHPSVVVPTPEVMRTLAEQKDSARGCLARKYCAAAVASRLDATLMVTAELRSSKGSFRLTMTSGRPLSPDQHRVSMRVPELSSLGINIHRCLSTLFPVATAAAEPASLH